MNTVGGFYSGIGHHHMFGKLSMDGDHLTQFGFYKESSKKDGGGHYVANWNGDKSPVVHQLDRFYTSKDLKDDSYVNAYRIVREIK